MRRREFLGILGGAAAVWPFASRAQPAESVRRIGVLMGYAENDPEAQIRLAAFKEALVALGWNEGRNLRIDLRWAASGNMDRASIQAKELVALRPEVILSNTTPSTVALHQQTKIIPIVFAPVTDPVGEGFVQSLPRPGGNITGFINFEPTMVGKWVDLLKDIAPRLTRVVLMFNPETAPHAENYLQPFEAAATKFGVTPVVSRIRRETDIEEVISRFGREPNVGLIAMADSFLTVHRKTTVETAMRHKVPLMYFFSNVPREGGLISYGVDVTDIFRRAARYIDRILKGEKPADLPVQGPTKYELVINLRAAKALGLKVPPTLLASADEVIE
jgi:putative tryptophan/tyrosine transport system substrate-binding protein